MKHVLTQAASVQATTADRWQKEHRSWVSMVKQERPDFFGAGQSTQTKTKTKRKAGEDKENAAEPVVEHVAKKRRISADKRLALAYNSP